LIIATGVLYGYNSINHSPNSPEKPVCQSNNFNSLKNSDGVTLNKNSKQALLNQVTSDLINIRHWIGKYPNHSITNTQETISLNQQNLTIDFSSSADQNIQINQRFSSNGQPEIKPNNLFCYQNSQLQQTNFDYYIESIDDLTKS